MKKLFLPILFTLSFFLPVGVAHAGFADVFTERFNNTVEDVYAKPEQIETVLPTAIGNIINMILGFAGVILIVIITYAAFLWLTARGDEGQVEKAKTWLRNGIIGLIITLMAFSITSFIVTTLQNSLQSTSGSTAMILNNQG